MLLVYYEFSVGTFESVVKSHVLIHISTNHSHLWTHTCKRYSRAWAQNIRIFESTCPQHIHMFGVYVLKSFTC